MKIVSAVAHRILKKQNAMGAQATFATSVLENTPELEELVSELLNTFNTKTAQRTGKFEVESEQYPFSGHMQKYLNGTATFLNFTTSSLKQLAFLIQNVYPASGGFILFAHYQVSAGEFMVVAKLNDTEGKVFNEDMSKVLKNSHLSLDKLSHVGRVNISAWQLDEYKYLTFVNAREGGKSSDYFVTFLGCSMATKPRVDTKRLVTVVEEFCLEKAMDEPVANAFKKSVFDHVKSIPKGGTVSLLTLANAVWPEDPQHFTTFINSSSNAPSDDFSADATSLKALVSYSVKMPGMKLWMTAEFKEQHQVRFNNKDELIISNAAAIRGELE
ncbi:nucleoid-associated protein [Stenotrophomonas lactitubi]|uniref:nucleoid-associated protein n=1 Tax=Stenotrophomonas lactitubi TaxID=2045214 RepID=UPI0033428630